MPFSEFIKFIKKRSSAPRWGSAMLQGGIALNVVLGIQLVNWALALAESRFLGTNRSLAVFSIKKQIANTLHLPPELVVPLALAIIFLLLEFAANILAGRNVLPLEADEQEA